MVVVFFVLSGYVLALPAVSRGRRWFDASYYPRRLLRLYIPVWAALIFGGCLHELHKSPIRGASWWLNSHAGRLSLSDGLHAATLLAQHSTWAFTTVIWSLRDEVWFSLLLPLFLAVALLARGRWRVGCTVAACFLIMYVGAGHTPSAITSLPGFVRPDLRFLPVFLLGSLLAFNGAAWRACPQSLFPLLALLCVCLLTTSYMWSGNVSTNATGVQYLLDVVGACLAVWIAVYFRIAQRWLNKRSVQWLGSRSFSLYLVHEPIVVAFGFLFGGRASVVPELLVAVPVSLLAAEVFWRIVERPAVQAARLVGHAVRLRVSRPAGIVLSPAPQTGPGDTSS